MIESNTYDRKDIFHRTGLGNRPDVVAPGKINHDYFADDTADTSNCTQCYFACCFASYTPSSIRDRTCISNGNFDSKVLFS